MFKNRFRSLSQNKEIFNHVPSCRHRFGYFLVFSKFKMLMIFVQNYRNQTHFDIFSKFDTKFQRFRGSTIFKICSKINRYVICSKQYGGGEWVQLFARKRENSNYPTKHRSELWANSRFCACGQHGNYWGQPGQKWRRNLIFQVFTTESTNLLSRLEKKNRFWVYVNMFLKFWSYNFGTHYFDGLQWKCFRDFGDSIFEHPILMLPMFPC